MSDAPYILEGTVENFERLVVENSRQGLVIVDFWAPWVGPSLKQRAILVDLAKRYQGRFLLVSINTDEQKPLVERFGVRSLPSFKLFHRGEMVAEYHGVQPEADYPRIIEQYVQRVLDPTSREVIAAWQAGDADRALQQLAEAIVADPENLELPALMGKILMRQQRFHDAHALLSALPKQARETVEIRDLLAHLDIIVTAEDADTPESLMQRLQADPKDADSLYQLAALRLVGDELEEALDLLLELARSNPAYRDGIARRGMRAVLDQLDAGDEQINRYRRELYRLDY
ncbi:MAG: thioredoxin [gamma proteobacterium symbiont of Ctena orbiculata]|uniref:Tetratricopeptide repeat protein n=1 Tax=Candidatus Thiodiazotropha taylori TaxID=2792791 RepID=A0A944M5D5_9GAMM|nr:tetratricopeptide repeat protein [Candidatus Thiodiazotropha taylori]PUB83412.1 MAG: thioredoxin [gamma proteobacterium symbiont of Ctena orbiculata]MBT2988316.1 tetratricopeptide repeat protein [Candidatus Thiodiazotropha taylori]MBT2998773.1 tetratricopeptide repeat protein [Candidatus Thiodiazotropha taylori]MBT2999565.1 tetratricopeptide repeat protein [Candidatus Thiodiazotropha taylori]